MYNSQSDDNLKSFVNIEELNTDYSNRCKSLSVLTQYFNKIATSKDLDKSLNLAAKVEKDLNNLDKFENQLSKSVEKKVINVKQNTSNRSILEKELEDTNSKKEILINKLQELEERIESSNVHC